MKDLQTYADRPAPASCFVFQNGTIEKFIDTSLKNVVIPAFIGGQAVTRIGRFAFFGCKATTIEIPGSVTRIEENAFESCTRLKDIKIPESVTYIGDHAFFACRKLTAVSVPGSVTQLGAEAFRSCEELHTLLLHNGLISIGIKAFESCGLIWMSIPSSVRSIGAGAFYRCEKMTSVYMPETITTIEQATFSWCQKLTAIRLPESLTEIGDSAFFSCGGLSAITIPAGVVRNGKAAFGGYHSPEKFTFLGARPPQTAEDAFGQDPSLTVYVPAGSEAAYEAALGADKNGIKVRVA